MRRILIASLFFVLVIVSCARPSGQLLSVAELSARTEAGAPVITVFKAPT